MRQGKIHDNNNNKSKYQKLVIKNQDFQDICFFHWWIFTLILAGVLITEMPHIEYGGERACYQMLKGG